jgi:hypothetical protein
LDPKKVEKKRNLSEILYLQNESKKNCHRNNS